MTRRRGRGRTGVAQGGVSLSPSEAHDRSTTSSSDSTSPASVASSSQHADGYFNQFQGFYDRAELSFTDAFSQLAVHQGWSRAEMREHRFEALEAEFDRYVGTDFNDLRIWQKVCETCGLEPKLPSITKCKKALATVYVNIYDFVEHCRHPDRTGVRTFSSLKQLRKYSVPRFLYPLGRAKENKFIKALLRPFFFHCRK